MNRALVTGGAGFIGSHLVDRLLASGWHVTVVDNFDPFYDRYLKEENIEVHFRSPHYNLVEADICHLEALKNRLNGRYDVIVHLAARVGVRPSLQDPIGYYEVNVRGTQNLLELARIWMVKQFVFASSSSVYGVNSSVPWREDDSVLLPISPYASTKVSGELLGHVYSHLYGIRFIALRLFTVFGPRQRPDLAIHKFARLMLKGEPVPVFGDGLTSRDYTYIDDVVNAIYQAIHYEHSRYEIINIGNNHPVSLLEMIEILQEEMGIKAIIQFQPGQPGDVPHTWASIEKASRLLGFKPKVSLREGIRLFVTWLRRTN